MEKWGEKREEMGREETWNMGGKEGSKEREGKIRAEREKERKRERRKRGNRTRKKKKKKSREKKQNERERKRKRKGIEKTACNLKVRTLKGKRKEEKKERAAGRRACGPKRPRATPACEHKHKQEHMCEERGKRMEESTGRKYTRIGGEEATVRSE